jgi:hypothetical protein
MLTHRDRRATPPWPEAARRFAVVRIPTIMGVEYGP